MRLSCVRTALTIAIALSVIACSKVTAENYAKIKSGQTYGEVVEFLGKPTRCDDIAGFRSCIWGDEKSNITVRFAGGSVILHSATNIR